MQLVLILVSFIQVGGRVLVNFYYLPLIIHTFIIIIVPVRVNVKVKVQKNTKCPQNTKRKDKKYKML